MKLRLLVAVILALSAAGVARAGSAGYAYCSTYDVYVLLYKSTDTFEELGKLRCNEKVEVITRYLEYFQVRTNDGRVGWVRSSDISGAPASVNESKTPFGLTNPNVAPPEQVALPLSNRDILNMHGMRLSDDEIIAKIRSGQCDFDTSPAGLQKLRLLRLPETIILAMIQAPAASAATESNAAKPSEVVTVRVPDGTALEVVLTESVSSDAVRQDTILPMTVVQDVVVNGVTVIQKGAAARARVIAITDPGRMGHPGEIGWAMQDVTAVNSDHVQIDFAAGQAAAANPAGGVQGSVAPTWEFRKNKPTVMAAGLHFKAVVHGETLLKLTPALANSLTVPQVAAQPSASTAVPPGSKQ